MPPVPPIAGADRVDGVAQALVGAGGWANLPLNWSGMKVLVGWLPPVAVAKLVVGLKPPWNQPQLRPAALSSSPTFWPVSDAASRVEQSS